MIVFRTTTDVMIASNFKAFKEKKGIGLGNILSRVEYMNGSLEIDSATSKGTTVIIEIPYTN